ncbi:MAG: hypothetical protein JOZ15_18815 [Acidobacteria bacterium]|nr:hypothetical protein [Acidobacteriota bacterium]
MTASPPGAPAPSVAPAAADADADSELRLARLKGQVAALEAALERRSYELQLLQRLLCPRDLAQWARVAAGLPPLPRLAYEPGYWHETRELSVADVQETLEDLWSSLHPERPPSPAEPAGPARTPGTPVTPRTPRP